MQFTTSSALRSTALTLLALGTLSLAACSNMSPRTRDTAIGATVGGVAGSVLTGGSTAGTVGGAVLGGVIGEEVNKKK